MSTAFEIPAKTHTVQFSKIGGPEVLEWVEIATPTPAPEEVLVKIEWGGINFIDTYFREGVYPSKLPRSTGSEVAGTIVALPTSTEVLANEVFKRRGFKVGDKVTVSGSELFKGYVAAPWTKVIHLPDDISTRTAAASQTSVLTALTFVKESYEVKKGDWILVHAAAGGLGLQLVQLIKKFGGNVIGTTSSDAKAKLAKEYGADHVVIYTRESVVDAVLKITNGEGVAAVYDSVGKDTFEDSLKSVARKGTLVSGGNASGVVPPFSVLRLVEKNVKLLRPTVGNYIFTPDEQDYYHTEYFKLLRDGLKINVHKEYPFTLDGVRQAQIDIKGRGTAGKLLIDFSRTQ